MAEIRLLDYSFQHPTTDQIKASGASGVLRYVCPAGEPKRITSTEAQQIRTAGLWLGLVFESTSTRASAGHEAGLADARMGAQQAAAVGYPTSAPLFFAVDQDTSWSYVAPYFQGVKDAQIPNPIGCYGSFDVVEGAASAGVPYRWQSAAWSRNQISARAHLYQRNAPVRPVAGTDENVLMLAMPLWGAPVAAKPTPPPVPQKIQTLDYFQEYDMMLIVKDPDSPTQWVVRPDLSAKIHIMDQATLNVLLSTPGYYRVEISALQIAQIKDL